MSGEHVFPPGTAVETLPSHIKTETLENPERSNHDLIPPIEIAERNGDSLVNNEIADAFSSRVNLENVFRPTYNEAQRGIGNPDFELNLGFPTFVVDASTEDIFRVWDLDIPDEEDEPVKQLNKALAATSLEPVPSTCDVFVVGKGIQHESLDELICGIEDLNLNGL